MEVILLIIPGQCFCVICFTFAFAMLSVVMGGTMGTQNFKPEKILILGQKMRHTQRCLSPFLYSSWCMLVINSYILSSCW